MEATKRAYAYVQENLIISAEQQEIDIREYADENNIEIVRIIADNPNNIFEVITKGETFLIYSSDTFSHSTLSCINLMEKLKLLGCNLILCKENIQTNTAAGELAIRMLFSMAEYIEDSIGEIKGKVIEKIRAEVRAEITAEVRAEIRAEIRAEVKAELIAWIEDGKSLNWETESDSD